MQTVGITTIRRIMTHKDLKEAIDKIPSAEMKEAIADIKAKREKS